MNSILFSTLGLCPNILKNLDTLGYHNMTPIQAHSLPYILKNRDILAKASTGSGKTAAFGIGLLSKLDLQDRSIQALVICPTRELAEQIGLEIRRLARLTPNTRVLVLCGGKPLRHQIESLKNGAHIVVGTPGRLQDHIERNTLNLNALRILVLDEADRMLDMGFYDNIIDIIKTLPEIKQTLLFSATYPSDIVKISQLLQKNPIEIMLEQSDSTLAIEQILYKIDDNKNNALLILLNHFKVKYAIIFCKTKKQCDEIAKFLKTNRFDALAIHGDLEQKIRDEVLLQFSNNSCSILVATDVAARGIDIKDLPVVINYDFPTCPKTYVHRIGRTGRSGKAGLALSLFTPNESWFVNELETTTASIKINDIKSLNTINSMIEKSTMTTLCINQGKKNKIRPSDILGALTAGIGLAAEYVGKINIFDNYSYVAINRTYADDVLRKLRDGKLKGRTFKIRYLSQ